MISGSFLFRNQRKLEYHLTVLPYILKVRHCVIRLNVALYLHVGIYSNFRLEEKHDTSTTVRLLFRLSVLLCCYWIMCVFNAEIMKGFNFY